MHLVFAALALAFIVLGFVGFAAGGLPTLIFWALAVVCMVAGWKARPKRLRDREDRLMNRPPRD